MGIFTDAAVAAVAAAGALAGSTKTASAPPMGLADRFAFISLRATEEDHTGRGHNGALLAAQEQLGEVEGRLAHYERELFNTGHASLPPLIEAEKAKAKQLREAISNRQKMRIPGHWRAINESTAPYAARFQSGTADVKFDPAVPVMPKGTKTFSEAIAAIRAKRRDLVVEVPAVKTAVAADLPRLVEAQINATIEKPTISMHESGERFTIKWPERRIQAEPSTLGGIPRSHDAAALACWLNRDAIIAELVSQAEQIVADAAMVMSPADKRSRLREIETELAELERLEAALVWAGLAVGEDVAFRPDTTPEAVLGIR